MIYQGWFGHVCHRFTRARAFLVLGEACEGFSVLGVVVCFLQRMGTHIHPSMR